MAAVASRPAVPEWVPIESWLDEATGVRWARIRWADGHEEVRQVKVSVDVQRVEPSGESHPVEVRDVRVGS